MVKPKCRFRQHLHSAPRCGLFTQLVGPPDATSAQAGGTDIPVLGLIHGRGGPSRIAVRTY
jgi:hypothetical protein